jgi:cytochrome c oxidase cbb3-type subunit 3
MKAFAIGIVAMSVAAVLQAQAGGQRGQAPPGRSGQPPRTVTSPRDAYPSRPPADPAAVERGKALYSVNCQFCHGADTRGGDSGPSLLRSGIVLDDQHGELMAPVIQDGRTERGMPKFSFTTDQVADIAAFVHTFRAAGYDESRVKPPSIVVGTAAAGQEYFASKCAACHSPSGDLKGIATKIADERLLQQTWLMPGTGGGRGGPPPVPVPPARVTVTLASGERVSGVLDRVDDFGVSLRTDAGTFRSFPTPPGAKTVVDILDPLKPHKDLLRVYTDADIHNVTAYLVTLK